MQRERRKTSRNRRMNGYLKQPKAGVEVGKIFRKSQRPEMGEAPTIRKIITAITTNLHAK